MQVYSIVLLGIVLNVCHIVLFLLKVKSIPLSDILELVPTQ